MCSHLVQGVLPHVASCQGFIVGEDHGIVLGIGLVAALPDPAVVVGQGVVKPPGRQGELGEPTSSQPAHPDPGVDAAAGVKSLFLLQFCGQEQRSQAGLGAGQAMVVTMGAAAPTELPAPPQEQKPALLRRGNRKNMKLEVNSAPLQQGPRSPDEGMSPGHSLYFSPNSPQAEI